MEDDHGVQTGPMAVGGGTGVLGVTGGDWDGHRRAVQSPSLWVQLSATAPDCPNMPTQPMTLTYWEAANEYLSEEGVATLDAEFQAKYPNVTLVRVAKVFSDIIATERLQASGPNPPDILVANGGYALLGLLVAAGLLRPLDSYAEAFGWVDRLRRISASRAALLE